MQICARPLEFKGESDAAIWFTGSAWVLRPDRCTDNAILETKWTSRVHWPISDGFYYRAGGWCVNICIMLSGCFGVSLWSGCAEVVFWYNWCSHAKDHCKLNIFGLMLNCEEVFLLLVSEFQQITAPSDLQAEHRKQKICKFKIILLHSCLVAQMQWFVHTFTLEGAGGGVELICICWFVFMFFVTLWFAKHGVALSWTRVPTTELHETVQLHPGRR